MTELLTEDEVRHVARLARIHLTEEQVTLFRTQLTSILGHIAQLNTLDTTGVQPLAHPTDITNRLANDDVGQPLPITALETNAPAMEDRLIAVPKVISTGGGDSA